MKKYLIVIIILFAVVSCKYFGDSYTNVQVTVQNENNVPLKDVTVYLESTEGKETGEKKTDAAGFCSLEIIGGKPQNLRLVVLKTEYKEQQIAVSPNQRSVVKVMMKEIN